MAKESAIVTHNSENPYCSPESVDGNAQYLRIILLKDDGTTQEIFRGGKFSEEKWKKRMKNVNRKSQLDIVSSEK